MPLEIKCLCCRVPFKIPPSRKASRNFCSIGCFAKWNCGERNPLWKGGLRQDTVYDINNLPQKLIDRFHLKYIKDKNGCWLWQKMKDWDGYGFFNIGRPAVYAHRVSWILKNGPIPKGLCVLHKCDVRNCVNPDHLWVGTQLQNIADRDKKGRMFWRNGKYAKKRTA